MFLTDSAKLLNAQSKTKMFHSSTDHGTNVCDQANPGLLEGCFGVSSLRETTLSTSAKGRNFGNEVNVRRQDTAALMTPESTSAKTAEKNHQDSRPARPAARKTSKRILAQHFLFPRGDVKSTMHDSVSATKFVEDLKSDAIVAENRYRIIEGRTDDDPNVRHAVNISSGNRVFLNFHDDLASLLMSEIYHGSISSHRVCRWIGTVRDVTDCPPFLVFEGGDYTFDQWLACSGRVFAEKRCALSKILEALADFHGQGRVIGNLTPNRIVWFSAEREWKLLDLRSTDAQRHERSMPSSLGAKFAAPERALSEMWQEKDAAPESAPDMWSFGAIVLEVLLSGEGLCCSDEDPGCDKRIALSRRISSRLARVPGEHAYTLLRNLLQIDPIKRCTASQALQSAFFRMPDRPRMTNALQNEFYRVSCPDVMDTAHQLSSEQQLPTAKTSVCVEYFSKRSNSSDPFHLRYGKEAYAISDTLLPRQSIFLLRAGQNFRLRFRHEYDALTGPSPRRVKAVYARVDEGEYVKLDTEMMLGRRRTLEVVAFVEPARLQSPRLLSPTLADEDVSEKYVKLDVVMDTTMIGGTGCIEERQHVIYCKVLPSTSRMRYHRFRKKCINAWNACNLKKDA